MECTVTPQAETDWPNINMGKFAVKRLKNTTLDYPGKAVNKYVNHKSQLCLPLDPQPVGHAFPQDSFSWKNKTWRYGEAPPAIILEQSPLGQVGSEIRITGTPMAIQIKDIRVMTVSDMTATDAISQGFDHLVQYKCFWTYVHKHTMELWWDKNPWVYSYDFVRIQ